MGSKPKRIAVRRDEGGLWRAVMLHWVHASRSWEVWVASDLATDDREAAVTDGEEWARMARLEFRP